MTDSEKKMSKYFYCSTYEQAPCRKSSEKPTIPPGDSSRSLFAAV